MKANADFTEQKMNAHAEAMMKRLVVVVVRISRNKLN